MKNKKRGVLAFLLALFLISIGNITAHAAVLINLGNASQFGVLAGAGITNTGTTTITGDIGTFPTTTITGLGTVVLNGTNHAGDSVTQSAKPDLVSAYDNAAGQAVSTQYGTTQELGGLTLSGGVYNVSASFGVTGTLTLNGDANSVWIFQMGSTLTTASNSHISLTGGAQASHVFWQVGSSATLGTNSQFSGTILAMDSITLTTGAAILGEVLARNGAVTMDGNTINAVPEPSSILLSVFGAVAVFGSIRYHCKKKGTQKGAQKRDLG